MTRQPLVCDPQTNLAEVARRTASSWASINDLVLSAGAQAGITATDIIDALKRICDHRAPGGGRESRGRGSFSVGQ